MKAALGLPLVALASLLAASPATAQTDCTRTQVQRAVPGGDSQPGVVVHCEIPEEDSLLAPDAAASACAGAASDPSLPAAALEACERTLANVQATLRRAKIRAALRDGMSDAAIQQAWGATQAELDSLRESAELSTPLSGSQ